MSRQSKLDHLKVLMLLIPFGLVGSAMLVGCEDDGFEDAGEEIDEGVDDLGDEIDDEID